MSISVVYKHEGDREKKKLSKCSRIDPMASLKVENIFKISRSEESLRWLSSISPSVS